jgi:predicted Ser/Thr protein kinase
MTPEDYTRVRDLFDQAMTLPSPQRRPFVDRHVPPGDPLHGELVAMVEAGDDSAFLAGAAGAGLLDAARTADPNLPAQIGNYQILRVLGRGGMGVVYLALRNDDAFRKVVALKVIGDSLPGDGAAHVERFRRERQILAGLDHPNIARILDGGNTEDGRPFYVMEYVDGSPIDDYCTRMNTDVPTRVRMMAQACDALDYLHRNAVAHRDIKPQNILVTLDGRVKLVDFGIAKLDTADGLLDSGTPGQPTLIMTPGYASPEQIAGDASGKAGDIYSVAVVIYQLLTGKLPFAGPDGRPNLEAQLSGRAPTPPSQEMKTARPATAPLAQTRISYPDLDRVVLTGLERDPRQRYTTVQLLADDLRRCLDGRPIGARPATLSYTVGKLVARNRTTAAVIALAVLVAGIGVWFAASAYIDGVRLQAREEEFERFVSVLAEKVSLWQQPATAVPAAERVADVQAASQRMQSPELRDLAERAPNPARVKQAVGVLRETLDRADAISQEQPNVRREIAVAFRRIGDFERTVREPRVADRQVATEAYQRAAAIAGQLRAADPSWAERELRELTVLLATIGGSIAPDGPAPVAAAPAVAPEPVPAAAPPPSSRPTAAAAATEGPAVDPALRAELEQRLRSVSADAARARRNLESLQASLASQGQVVRSDVTSAIDAADGLIEDARVSLDADDLATAEDYLRRAGAQVRRVLQAVGG